MLPPDFPRGAAYPPLHIDFIAREGKVFESGPATYLSATSSLSKTGAEPELIAPAGADS